MTCSLCAHSSTSSSSSSTSASSPPPPPPPLLPAAVKGILEAQQFNTCGRRSNGTNECIEEVDLLTAENDTNPSEREREGGREGGVAIADTVLMCWACAPPPPPSNGGD